MQDPPKPVIAPSILLNSVNSQNQCPLFALPAEIRDRILLAAITTDAATPCIIIRLFLSLTCKKLAAGLAYATSTLHGSVPGISRSGVLTTNNIPKNVTRHDSTAAISARAKVMSKLSVWLRKEDGWAFCSVCLVYKQMDGGLGAEKGSWRKVKKSADKSSCTAHSAAAARVGAGASFTPTANTNRNPGFDGNPGSAPPTIIEVGKEGAKGEEGAMEKAGWMTMEEEHLVCSKHRFTALQMVLLREK